MAKMASGQLHALRREVTEEYRGRATLSVIPCHAGILRLAHDDNFLHIFFSPSMGEEIT
jgi:hypothetical protein